MSSKFLTFLHASYGVIRRELQTGLVTFDSSPLPRRRIDFCSAGTSRIHGSAGDVPRLQTAGRAMPNVLLRIYHSLRTE